MTSLVLAAVLAVQGVWEPGPTLPRPVSNNAVVAVETSRGPAVFSFLGLDSSRRWDGVVSWAFRWNVREAAWSELAPVPGPGRLAGTAQAVKSRIYLLGGYTVAEDGSERSVPNVDIYDPEPGIWSSGAPIPVPSDDAVSGVWRDSLIYLVSGWHDRDNVAEVQVYDPATDSWRQATPIPGRPVFGHAGGLAGDVIVYLDGVRVDTDPRRFSIEGSAWRGDIDPADPLRIVWRRLDRHPGPPLYRAAAGAIDPVIVFAGGTDNPYNYDGVGYDGVRSSPRRRVFRYDPTRDRWTTLDDLPEDVMDLRGLVLAGDRLVIAGGMRNGQRVSAHVWTRRLAEPH